MGTPWGRTGSDVTARFKRGDLSPPAVPPWSPPMSPNCPHHTHSSRGCQPHPCPLPCPHHGLQALPGFFFFAAPLRDLGSSPPKPSPGRISSHGRAQLHILSWARAVHGTKISWESRKILQERVGNQAGSLGSDPGPSCCSQKFLLWGSSCGDPAANPSGVRVLGKWEGRRQEKSAGMGFGGIFCFQRVGFAGFGVDGCLWLQG